jgi:hypothetical protein
VALLFNNKDNKIGYHNTYIYFFKQCFSYACRFPGTAKSCFGFHCTAAAELLVNLEVYINFLERVRSAKTKPGFTNIEQNLWNALHNIPTLTELAILALHDQAIGHLYIQHICSYAGSAIELGPFHKHLKEHLCQLIVTPDLLLSSEASCETGTFLGHMWHCPDIVFCILCTTRSLPNLANLLVEYFKGELKGWDQFTKEWRPNSKLIMATDAQHACAYVAAIKDACEGALCQARVLSHQWLYKNNERNGRLMYLQDGAINFVRAMFVEASHDHMQAKVRKLNASGAAAKACAERNAAEGVEAAKTCVRQAKSQAK